MYYYILDDSRTVINAIVLSPNADPADFGAVADERVFRIGEVWSPPEPQPSETELLRRQVADLQNLILSMRLGG